MAEVGCGQDFHSPPAGLNLRTARIKKTSMEGLDSLMRAEEAVDSSTLARRVH
ncbi:hypothetical protein J6590_096189 [Homalodisca vitripennis]|nr:hypothetical protein J6590_096189 [Homalodisca vitripennis]